MHRCCILVALYLLVPHGLQAQGTSRYPNELAGFRFFGGARWRTLQPLVATMADVRRTLGDPARAVDIAHYFAPYPGDAAAECPLFTYESDKDWQVLVYFVGPNTAYGELPHRLDHRVFSIDLIPKKPVHFTARFPKVFRCKPTLAVDATWNDYTDGSGLCYSVYTSHSPFGPEAPGDLNRISYGAPPAELARLTHR